MKPTPQGVEVRVFGTNLPGAPSRHPKASSDKTVAELAAELDAIEATFAAEAAEVGRQEREREARQLAGIERLRRLPEPGEAFHLVTAKRYSLWHVVKATLHLASPATIAYLGIATLGFSKDNLEELLQALDGGQIGKVDFLFSVYFKSNEKEICQRLAHELTTRGHRVVAMLSHAKVLLLELTDGRRFVVESSANLRSCSSIEQITVTHDAALLDFHRQWISEVMEAKTR